jgi:hypothetical protein
MKEADYVVRNSVGLSNYVMEKEITESTARFRY